MGLKITRKVRWVLPAMTLLLIMAVALPVLAEGDGSGGGQGVPLGLASSIPANGAQNVALDTRIKLVFNKNVINMTVKENNRRCFALYAGSTAVPVDVQMADDQINPELKREVNLIPLQALQPDTDYTVAISRSLQAKSGSVLGKDVKIKFKTAAAEKVVTPAPAGEEKKSAETPAAVTPGNTPQQEPNPTVDSGESNAIPPEKNESQIKPEGVDPTQTDSTEKKPPLPEKNGSLKDAWTWPVLIVLVIVLAAGYGYLKKRR